MIIKFEIGISNKVNMYPLAIPIFMITKGSYASNHANAA